MAYLDGIVNRNDSNRGVLDASGTAITDVYKPINYSTAQSSNTQSTGGLGSLWDGIGNVLTGKDYSTGVAYGTYNPDTGVTTQFGSDSVLSPTYRDSLNAPSLEFSAPVYENGVMVNPGVSNADIAAQSANKIEAQKALDAQQSSGLTGSDITQGVVGVGQLGLGYLGYKQNEKALDATIANNAANLAMAEDQLYYDKAKGETYRDATNRSVLAGFGSKS